MEIIKKIWVKSVDFVIKAILPIALTGLGIAFNDYLFLYPATIIIIAFLLFSVVSYFFWNWLLELMNEKSIKILRIIVSLLFIICLTFGILFFKDRFLISNTPPIFTISGIHYTQKAIETADFFTNEIDLLRAFELKPSHVWNDVHQNENYFLILLFSVLFLSMGFVSLVWNKEEKKTE